MTQKRKLLSQIASETGLRILIVGSGAREHAYYWAAWCSSSVSEVLITPGNAGINPEHRREVKADDIDGIVRLAVDEQIDLVIPGPELPLMLGLKEQLLHKGIVCFGPSMGQAIATEGSKSMCREICRDARVPIPNWFRVFEDHKEARCYVTAFGQGCVVKADGLDAGKGVIVANTAADAVRAIDELATHGECANRLVIECLERGTELSVIALVNGTNFALLPVARDVKRANVNDNRNTGGMGARSSDNLVDEETLKRIKHLVFERFLNELARRRIHYVGFLYAGLMITDDGRIILIEFNCRGGDPEMQAILLRLQSDFIELIVDALENKFDGMAMSVDPRASACVVVAAEGYPGKPQHQGGYILGDTRVFAEDRHTGQFNGRCFHAGTRSDEDGRLMVSSGRIFTVGALAPEFGGALLEAYRQAGRIEFPGAWTHQGLFDALA